MKGTRYNLKQMKMDTVSPATRLLDKRRLMYQVQEAYERQKEEETRRLDIFTKKEEELRERDRAVQEKFVDFSKVINENDAKLQWTENRIKDEKKRIDTKMQRKGELESKLADLKTKARNLEEQVQNMKNYEKLLERVREQNSEEFSDINDILNLYQKLSSANRNLKEQHKKLEQEKNEKKAEKDTIEKKKRDQILQLNIEISKLEKQNEDIGAERSELSKLLDQSNANSINKQVEIGHIFMAIDNLFERCCAESKIHHFRSFKPLAKGPTEDINIKTNEAIQKLDVIKCYTDDFRYIISELARENVLEKSATARRDKIMTKEQKTSSTH